MGSSATRGLGTCTQIGAKWVEAHGSLLEGSGSTAPTNPQQEVSACCVSRRRQGRTASHGYRTGSPRRGSPKRDAGSDIMCLVTDADTSSREASAPVH